MIKIIKPKNILMKKILISALKSLSNLTRDNETCKAMSQNDLIEGIISLL